MIQVSCKKNKHSFNQTHVESKIYAEMKTFFQFPNSQLERPAFINSGLGEPISSVRYNALWDARWFGDNHTLSGRRHCLLVLTSWPIGALALHERGICRAAVSLHITAPWLTRDVRVPWIIILHRRPAIFTRRKAGVLEISIAVKCIRVHKSGLAQKITRSLVS